MVSVKANDHWAFLEEIEAPMWVDLTLEANLYSHSIADEWFESSHIEKLKASERESVGASSPQLPSSVSRSRGKDFKRKNWAGQVENLRLNNQHPVDISSGSSPILNSSSARRLKPKSSYINPTRISSSKSSTSESSVATNIMPSRLKTSSVSENSKSRFTSSTQKRESRTDSMVTAESKMQLQQQVVEVTSKVFGQSDDHQHPVDISSGSSPILNSSSARRLKPKSSYINPTRISSSKSSTSESSVATNIMPSRLKTSSVSENSKSRFTSSTQKRESRTDSMVTAESKMQLQQQVVEVTSKVFGQSDDHQHPVDISSGSSLILNSSSARRLKPKSSYVNPTRISSSKSSTSESSVAMNIMPSRLKTSSVSENSKSRFTSSTQKRESRTDSTVTADSKMQLQQQVVEVSSKVFGQSDDLISIMRRSLRNSRVTRQASRVETTNFQRSGSCKSLTLKKSSVGSCSNTGCDAKSLTMSNCHQKRNLVIRNSGRMICSAEDKMKSVNTKTPVILVEAEKSFFKPISRSFHAKTGKQEAVKPKLGHAKALAPQRVDQRNSLHATLGAKGNASYGGKNRVVVVGKENVNGRVSYNHKVNDKETRIGGKVVGWNGTKQNIKGKVNDKSDGKPKNGIGRIYLR